MQNVVVTYNFFHLSNASKKDTRGMGVGAGGFVNSSHIILYCIVIQNLYQCLLQSNYIAILKNAACFKMFQVLPFTTQFFLWGAVWRDIVEQVSEDRFRTITQLIEHILKTQIQHPKNEQVNHLGMIWITPSKHPGTAASHS